MVQRQLFSSLTACRSPKKAPYHAADRSPARRSAVGCLALAREVLALHQAWHGPDQVQCSPLHAAGLACDRACRCMALCSGLLGAGRVKCLSPPQDRRICRSWDTWAPRLEGLNGGQDFCPSFLGQVYAAVIRGDLLLGRGRCAWPLPALHRRLTGGRQASGSSRDPAAVPVQAPAARLWGPPVARCHPLQGREAPAPWRSVNPARGGVRASCCVHSSSTCVRCLLLSLCEAMHALTAATSGSTC